MRPYGDGCDTAPVPWLEGIYVAAGLSPPRHRPAAARTTVEDWARGRGFTELGSDADLDNLTSRLSHALWGFDRDGARRALPQGIEMKTIGLIGGMSWESTAHYYRILNEETARSAWAACTRRQILLHSVDFAPIEDLQRAGDWDGAGAILADIARGLEAAGAGVIGLATNTMHIVADADHAPRSRCRSSTSPTPTADALIADGFDRVGLLGTRFTMEKPFYKQKLADRGLEVLVPDVGITNLNGIIYEELVLGIVRDESRADLCRGDRPAGGAWRRSGDPRLHRNRHADRRRASARCRPYDTTELHAKALVAAALA